MNDLTALHAWVKKRVRKSRFEHVQRVVGMAVALSERWQGPIDQTAAAALLHDCARDMSVPELQQCARDFGIEIGIVERYSPLLLHAAVGAELVRRELNITDATILDAIRYHTTGRASMTLVEKIVFIADYAEPARTTPGVEGVRTLLQSDLDSALRRVFDEMIRYIVTRGWLIHPDTVAARNALYMQIAKEYTH